jgi:DNA-binding LacI/PurR family transcriptional regulator
MVEREGDASSNSTTAGTSGRVTMSDVAAAAGVAQSTVSRILNDAKAPIPVSTETRDRVRAIAEELGYRPNPFARALRGAPSMLLGTVVRDITDPFFAGAIDALSLECKARGYSVVLGNARSRGDEALAMAAVLEARQCDAIVLLGDFTDEQRLLQDLAHTNARVVGLWYGARTDVPFPTVGVNNRSGVFSALEHLWTLGHRRIGYVGAVSLGDMRERLDAYRDFMSEHGAPLDESSVLLVPNSLSSGEPALSVLRDCDAPATAVFAATDTIALGLLHAVDQLGLSVPRDLSVVGFDDILMAEASVPALTTVRMPIDQIVARGVEMCLGPDASVTQAEAPHVVLEPSLVIRASSAALR